MKTTTSPELLAFAHGIISDPDPGRSDHWMDLVFECNSGDGDPSIADPDEEDGWA